MVGRSSGSYTKHISIASTNLASAKLRFLYRGSINAVSPSLTFFCGYDDFRFFGFREFVMAGVRSRPTSQIRPTNHRKLCQHLGHVPAFRCLSSRHRKARLRSTKCTYYSRSTKHPISHLRGRRSIPPVHATRLIARKVSSNTYPGSIGEIRNASEAMKDPSISACAPCHLHFHVLFHSYIYNTRHVCHPKA